MFTGLIEATGEVDDVARSDDGMRIRIRTGLAADLTLGDSLAVNGVCLTVTATGDGAVQADIGPETARVTALGALRPRDAVNLERPLRADGRLGGHFVQGHVDGTGVIEDIRREPDAYWLTIGFPAALAPYFIPKGSITVDGISLTVAGLAGMRFDVMIIPFTWEHTNLSARQRGDRVNLECDVIGKYVVRLAELAGADPARRGGIKAV